MILPRPIYSGLLYAAAPAAMLYLYKRSRKQPQYLEHWSERFGTAHYPPRTKGRTRIWIHAVSVGETRATFSLVESILKRWPNTEILYTHMTPTGREVGAKFAQKFGNRIAQCYLPYDTPRAVKKFLSGIPRRAGEALQPLRYTGKHIKDPKLRHGFSGTHFTH